MKNYSKLNEVEIVELFSKKMKDYVLDKRTELKSEKFELMNSFKIFIEFEHLALKKNGKEIIDVTINDILSLDRNNDRIELIKLLRNIIVIYLNDFIDKEEVLGCYKIRLIEYLNFLKKHSALVDPNSTPLGLKYPIFDFNLEYIEDYVRYYVDPTEKIIYLNYVILQLDLQNVSYTPDISSSFRKYQENYLKMKKMNDAEKERMKVALNSMINQYKEINNITESPVKEIGNIKWNGDKTDLVEIVYGMIEAGLLNYEKKHEVVKYFFYFLGVDYGSINDYVQELKKRYRNYNKLDIDDNKLILNHMLVKLKNYINKLK